MIVVIIHINVAVIIHTCHILPPSEIDWGLFLFAFTDSGGKRNIYFTELAER